MILSFTKIHNNGNIMLKEGKIVLTDKVDIMYKTFGFRYMVGPQTPPVQLHSLGWQIQNSISYYCDGMNRQDETGNCIFQYTLSGNGILEINGISYTLREGDAFIAHIPSNHSYYLPESCDKWEFIFFTLHGDYVNKEWKRLQEMYSSVITLKKNSDIIQYWLETYLLAANNEITSGYQTSYIAYEFLMRLIQSLAYPATNEVSLSIKLEESIGFMKDCLHKDLILEDISNSVQMSKYHYLHTFTKYKGVTPWNFLTKLRIEYSIKLLLTTKESLEVISSQVGYRNANYFNKVFFKYVGMSPGKLRKKYHNINDFTLNL
jgi:AraC-like DNA-binding protein